MHRSIARRRLRVCESIGSSENKRKRELQIRLCSQCHSERFAREQLQTGDKVYGYAQGAFDEAAGIVKGLQAEGISGLSEIEQRMFRLDHFWRGSVWKSAFHGDLIGPTWNGWYKIQEELGFIRSEATRLRRLRSLAPSKE
jgi:hypothetical protein